MCYAPLHTRDDTCIPQLEVYELAIDIVFVLFAYYWILLILIRLITCHNLNKNSTEKMYRQSKGTEIFFCQA